VPGILGFWDKWFVINERFLKIVGNGVLEGGEKGWNWTRRGAPGSGWRLRFGLANRLGSAQTRSERAVIDGPRQAASTGIRRPNPADGSSDSFRI